MHSNDISKQTNFVEFVTLVAGGQHFCIEIQQIREIRRWSPVTTLPHTPDHVLGVINLRGSVIPIIDLAAKLGFETIAPSERHVIIIAAIGDQIMGFLVESVSEILGVDAQDIKDAPSTDMDDTTRSVDGIIPGDGEMTKIISLNALLAANGAVAA